MKIKLSVIIPYTYGGPEREEALVNLLNCFSVQVFTKYELTIVEEIVGNVKHNTKEENSIISKYKQLSNYIALKDWRYFNKSWCLNVAVRQANSNNVLVIDADSLIGKDYLGEVMKFKESYPNFFSGYASLYCLPGPDNPITRLVKHKDMKATGGAWFMNKDFFFDRLGGMNENYFGYGGEDNDIWKRVNYLLNNKVPELPYTIIHQYHPWHKLDGANPLSNKRLYYLKRTEKNPQEVIKRLKAADLGKLDSPTLIDIQDLSE